MDENPLILQQCDECNTLYRTQYKNLLSKYVFLFFNFLSRYLYYIYASFGLIGAIINITISNISYIFNGVSIGSILFSIFNWTCILLANRYYNLKDILFPFLMLLLSIILVIINIYFTYNWLDGAILIIISSILLKSKKYLFVLSSKFPYLTIDDYQEVDI